jgi:hypothetical protein
MPISLATLWAACSFAVAAPLPWPGPTKPAIPAHQRSARVEPVLVEQDLFPPCEQPHQAIYQRPAWAFASSQLTDGSVIHTAANAIDGDPSTAWVEGAKGNGIGERLVVAASDAHGIALIPGYAKDEARWSKNHRVSTVQIRWLRKKDGVPDKERYEPDDLELLTDNGLIATLQIDGGIVLFGKTQHVNFGTYWHQDPGRRCGARAMRARLV